MYSQRDQMQPYKDYRQIFSTAYVAKLDRRRNLFIGHQKKLLICLYFKLVVSIKINLAKYQRGFQIIKRGKMEKFNIFITNGKSRNMTVPKCILPI